MNRVGRYVGGQSGNNGGLYHYMVPKGKVAEFKRVAKEAFSRIGLKVVFTKTMYGLDKED